MFWISEGQSNISSDLKMNNSIEEACKIRTVRGDERIVLNLPISLYLS